MTSTQAESLVRPDAEPITLTVRYFAGARAAAGTADEALALPSGTSVAEVIDRLGAAHGESLTRVLQAASFLLDEVAVRDRSARPPDGAVLDVLPPFAGG